MSSYFYEPSVEKGSPKMERLIEMREEAISELKSSPYFLRVGN